MITEISFLRKQLKDTLSIELGETHVKRTFELDAELSHTILVYLVKNIKRKRKARNVGSEGRSS